jgi:hypothetical protein
VTGRNRDAVNHVRSCRAISSRRAQKIPVFIPRKNLPRDGAMRASRSLMTSYVYVIFKGIDRNPSIEATVHRWVARFEAMRFEVLRAIARIEPAGRNRTAVQLTLVLANGTTRTVATTRPDPYVAVSDAFRAVRQQLLAASPTTPGRLVA